VAGPAAHAARSAAAGNFCSGGHVLDVEDLLATWVVELALHHLDLIVDLPSQSGPSQSGPSQSGPSRMTLQEDERRQLGADLAERYPAFG